MEKTDIEYYREEVARFLRGFDSVEIHQFGQTILYIPIYLVIHDLKSECKLDNIKLVDSNSSDEVTVENVKKEHNSEHNSFLSDEGNKRLIIGLSELYNDKKKKPDEIFHHFAIIERVPLWGLALQNNKKIKKIRDSKKGVGVDDYNDYWELFGSKFSLLNKSDFKELTVSLYPEGSTIYRIFTKFIKGTEDVILAPHTMDVDEFDDLFSGTADVCLTVHPTYAIKRSQIEGTQLEVVYNHYGKPTAFTSLYMKKYNDIEKDNIAKLFMNYLKILVYDKINKFYDPSDNDYQANADIYCKINKSDDSQTNKGCNISKMLGDKCYKNNKCGSPSVVAQQIINDSRIYYHDLYASEEIKKDDLDIAALVYLTDNIDDIISNGKVNVDHPSLVPYKELITRGKFKCLIESRLDPIFYTHKYWINLSNITDPDTGEKLDNHSSNTISNKNKNIVISEISKIYKSMGLQDHYIAKLIFPINCYNDININLRIETTQHIFTFSHEFIPLKLCFFTNLIRDALTHLNSNLSDTRAQGISVCVCESKTVEEQVIKLIVIKYRFNSTKSDKTALDSKFITGVGEDEHALEPSHQLAFRSKILRAYWIKDKKPTPCFMNKNNDDHGRIEVTHNGSIEHTWKGEYTQNIPQLSNDEEAWILTFKTYKKTAGGFSV